MNNKPQMIRKYINFKFNKVILELCKPTEIQMIQTNYKEINDLAKKSNMTYIIEERLIHD